MLPKKQRKFAPKPKRANAATRARRQREEEGRLAKIAANAAAIQLERERERERMRELEGEGEEERQGVAARNTPASGGFWGRDNEEEETGAGSGVFGGSSIAGGEPNMFSGLVSRPKRQPTPVEIEAQRVIKIERRKAQRRRAAERESEAAKKADAKIIKGMARLRIAERIAAGEDVAFDEDEDEEEEDRIWTTVLGGWKLPDEEDDDDVCGGAGGLGGSFGGGSGGAGGQGVGQAILSGN